MEVNGESSHGRPPSRSKNCFLNPSHVDFFNVCYVPHGNRQPSTICMLRCYWTTAHLAKYSPFGLSQECLTRNAVLLQWEQSSKGRRKEPLSKKVEMIRCYLKLPSFVSRGRQTPGGCLFLFFLNQEILTCESRGQAPCIRTIRLSGKPASYVTKLFQGGRSLRPSLIGCFTTAG